MANNIKPTTTKQAIHWFVRSVSGTMSDQEQEERDQWLDANPEHAQAWQRMQGISSQLQPSEASQSPLIRSTLVSSANMQRRRLLKGLAWTSSLLTSGWIAKDQPFVLRHIADFSTSTGEQHEVTLADGTHIIMDTNTMLNIAFNDQQRHIKLISGQIMIATAKDPAMRPLIVSTEDGSLKPVGTRFSVRRDESDKVTRLIVTAGAVEMRPAKNPNTVVTVYAGQQSYFDSMHVAAISSAHEVDTAWTKGMLSAERMRLSDFLNELARYRTGWLHCSPEAADILVTGTYPLHARDATDHILNALQETLPIKLNFRTRYWITVGKA
ncbi:FecR domain-containing protein [Methylobacillus gramineus]|uniref:FecR domain-containing protein n=1 Tax=Methylobacillus gramineus TaxID=755169 RepID=UPI001CFF5A34|nr:FecR domain-containing protein [Methylobacillus gramineus]MCB5184806.1 FecR domain-containing protein [Methylobacillus gramineus]